MESTPILSPRAVLRSRTEDADDLRYFKGLRRLIRRAGERRLDDPTEASIRLARELDAEVDAMWATLVARWRRAGWTDTEIGGELGLTGPGVRMRWPRWADHVWLGEAS